MYESGSVTVTKLRIDRAPVIAGIIIIPKLLKTNPLPLYNVYSTNIISQDKNFRVNLPNRLACSDKETCWEVVEKRCIKTSHTVACLSGFYHEPLKCMRSLAFNRTDNCKLLMAKNSTAA